ncbi:MAG: SpoIIE family protein phosphatase [Microcoleaceae cyanobacterium]
MNPDEGSQLKLMIIDDEPDNLDLLFRTFRRDFQVYKATNAVDALEILDEAGEMAVIISDQRMPEMNGTEFLGQTVERFPDTIRILLTGYTDVEDLVGAINSGKVFKYITKPWNPRELKIIVEQACETYEFSKQRTEALRRALRRESLYNDVVIALRESLDYFSMLQTFVQTLGEAFEATGCCIYTIEDGMRTAETFLYTAIAANHSAWFDKCNHLFGLINPVLEERKTQVISDPEQGQHRYVAVPLTYQLELLAILLVFREGETGALTEAEIQLLEAVAEQASLALSQAKLHQRTVALAEQMQNELQVARQIQTNLLRQSWPDLDTVNIQACCYPAREVGGDFFEVYIHAQGDIWVALGDVSGKGVPAALFMASTISVIRRELSLEVSPEPEQVMQNLNRLLSDDLISNNHFITMVLARYTPSTHQLAYTNAGHVYPMVWSRLDLQKSVIAGDEQDMEPDYLKTRGIPLGILPNWRGQGGEITLSPGDIFLLTSDGITEASVKQTDSSDGTPTYRMLYQQGLWRFLCHQQDTFDLENLLADIREQNPIHDDDQTMLSLEVLFNDEN